MRLSQIIVAILSGTILSGCADLHEVTSNVEYKKHENNNNIKYLSCGIEDYKTTYENKEKNKLAAILSFPFAMMASNAYDDTVQFVVPGWERGDRYQTGKGLSADIYKRTGNGLPRDFFNPTTDDSSVEKYMVKNRDAIAVVFRGTEFFKPNDWLFGNFNIYWGGQFEEADELIDLIKRKNHINDSTVLYTTGHSLGGGLAIHGSLTHNLIYAIGFDPSPRFFDPHNNEKNGSSKQFVIAESGEALQSIRKIWPTMNVVDESVYFDFATGWSVLQHNMYKLARGLTMVAASAGDASAIWAMKKILSAINF